MRPPHYERVSLFREATMGDSLAHSLPPRTEKEDSIRHRVDPKFNYKPFILRTIPLVLLFLFTLVLIGLLELAAIELPHGTNKVSIAPHALNNTSSKRSLSGRDIIDIGPQDFTNTSSSGISAPSSTLASLSTTSPPATASNSGSPAGSNLASSSSDESYYSVLANTEYAVQSDYLAPDRTQTLSSAAATTQSGALVNAANIQDPVFSPATSEYVAPDQTHFFTSGASSVTVNAPDSNHIEPQIESPIESYIETTKTQTQIITSAGATQTQVQVHVQAQTTAPASPTPGESLPNQPTPTATSFVLIQPLATTIVQSSTSVSVVVFSASTANLLVTAGNLTFTSHTTFSASSSTALFNITHTVVSTPPPMKSNIPVSNADDAFAFEETGKVGVLTTHWKPGDVFKATYLPVVLAVIYRMFISAVYNSLTLIEPFRQLMEPNGALADKAFFSFFQVQSSLYGPIPALMKGRLLLALSATAYLAASFFPALASEAIWTNTHWDCPVPLDSPTNPCDPRMTASMTIIRTLQGLLGFTGLVILVLIVLLFMKTTGLPGDPSSMSTLGSLMRHPGLIDDLNDLPVGPGARAKDMKASMAGKRYKLEAYKTEIGTTGYGIRPLMTDLGDERSSRSRGRGSYTPIEPPNAYFDNHSAKNHRFRWMDLILLFLILGVLGVVIAYYLDGHDDGFNRFFSSNTFGPRFILAGSVTVIVTSWRSVEQSQVVMAPYVLLSRRPAGAQRTVCFAPTNTPLLSTLRTISDRYWLAATVTLVTLSGEALNIVIAGVPFATGEEWTQFLVSSYLSIAALSIMAIVILVVMLRRRVEPKIPVRPDTLAYKMYYLAGSRVVDDLEGTEWQNDRERKTSLQSLQKKYTFQPMMRRDGRRTWLVDEMNGDGQFP